MIRRQHLSAFIWLRWRLRVNQLRKAGTVNAVVTAVPPLMVVVGMWL